ncbi:Hypothetical protein SRAE_1000026400 [Strongyloides ratti]|uniref:Uncharacterized protein n=1 Tax=Strongyloides ratti TaxID=34506 RepID=A0A090MU49_STRRB|nr:Hypothetical protein SRAE_1000026400 [Strongyloides ratti]CEF61988.1 Hypothetical protein SRAE_1000026400 [Strongyloides ratti]
MASAKDTKSDSTTSNKSDLNEMLKLNEDAFANLLKQQLPPAPRNQFYGDGPFTEYMDKNAIFFSQIENLSETEKTAHLLGCLADNVYKLLKLSRPNIPLSKCNYSELVDDLMKSYAETIKYARDYTKLLLIQDCYCNINDLHRTKIAEWRNLEETTSQKIPDLVKILLIFDNYKEPIKLIAEKYIQDHHSKLNLNDFCAYMESESLFVQENSCGVGAFKKGRSRK